MAADLPDDDSPNTPPGRPTPLTERELREAEDLALAASGLGSGLLKRQPFPNSDDSVAVQKVCPHCGTEYETAARFCPADGTSLRPKGSDSLIGRVLAERYHILKRIGEGGMGRVYLGEHVKMNRQCAIKVMNPALVNDHESATRFAREASSAARIIHPNVAAVFDYGESDGLVYLVMEFVEGEPLSRILAREAPLSMERAVDLTRQIADGLGAAHELGIVHRDLKPDNILVARTRAGREVAKVVDFGIAKAMQESVGDALTRTGLVIGTPEFMSPEQLLGDPIDARSDLYALGCILHLMLTAMPPFEAATRELMIKRRLAEDAPRVQTLDPALPDALDRITARLLARSPGDRYGSAAEVRDALAGAPLRASAHANVVRTVLTPTPRSAPTVAFDSLRNATTEVNAAPIPAEPPVPVTRRRPRAALLAAGATGLVALVVGIARLGSTPAERPAPPARVPADSVSTPAPAPTAGAGLRPGAPAIAAAPAVARAAGAAARESAAAPSAGGQPRTPAQRAEFRNALRDRRAKQAARDSILALERTIPIVVRTTIRDYARAIESRDMATLRAANPLMSGDQEEGWKRMFDATDSIRARVTSGGATVTATTIDAPFTLNLRLVRRGSPQASTSTIRDVARFTKENGGWLLRTITSAGARP